MVGAARVLCVLVVLAGPGGSAAQTGSSRATTTASGVLDDARALAAAGRHQDALTMLAAAVRRFARSGDRDSEAEAELLRSSSLRALADRPAAIRSADRALSLAGAADNPSLQTRALTQLARIHSDGGQETEAAELLQRAWTMAGRSRDPKLAILVGEARAANARARGHGVEAVGHFGDVIAAADGAGDLDYSIRGRTGRSTALLGLGRFDEALADGERAFALAASASARLRANATFALAQVHAHLWNLDRAAELWEQAISLYGEVGPQIGVALSHRQSMDTWLALGDFDRAFHDGSAALALYERTGSQGSLPDTLARLALVQARRGDAASAGEYAARARAAAADAPARRLVFIENDLGLVELYTGRPDRAAQSFHRVRTAAQAQGDAEYEWRADYGLGRAALALGRPVEAQTHLEAAVSLVERLRGALPAPAQRAAFMAQRGMVYEALIQTLMTRSTAPDDGFARRAFDIAETGRARALADQLAEAAARSADPDLQRIAGQEAESSRRLASIQKALQSAGDAARRETLAADLAQAEHEHESLAARGRRDSPHLASMVWPQPITADGAKALLAPGEALVEFALGDETGWAWIIRSDQILSYAIPRAGALEDLVRQVRSAAMEGDTARLRQAGLETTRALFGPGAHLLRGATRLIVVPDGVLHRLPFAALPNVDQGWMIERHALSVAPSATVLASLRSHAPAATRRLLAFAAPQGLVPTAGSAPRGEATSLGLPNAAAEAREAARLAGGDSGVRAAAREADVKDTAAGAYRILHFAAHAVVDERVPRRSAILLEAAGTDDGLLQLNEISGLRLDAQLVVLAACRSQMGRTIRGEGLLSLSRAFLQAGARAVVASLWDVRDADSRRVMRLFYGHLRRGVPADEALQRAQLELLRASGPSASPARWAAFVVSGDARPAVLEPVSAVWPDSRVMAGALLMLVVTAAVVWRFRRRRSR